MSSPSMPDSTRIHRCSACGHRIAEESASACPLCGFSFSFKDPRATGGDITPYAKTYAHGISGWRLMCEWVWLAGTERLKHLAMMRASVASRRFARINITLMVMALGVFQVASSGWQWENRLDHQRASRGGVEPERVGWVHAASLPRPLPPGLSDDVPIELWWSVPQAALAGVIAVPAGVLITWLGLGILRWLVTRGHTPAYRADRRMTAAIHYATAWMVPFSLAGVAIALLPVSHIGRMSGWSYAPTETALLIAAAVVAGCSACAGWFWLSRLGFTAPPASRTRVAATMTLAPPIIASGAALGWYYGVAALHTLLVDALRLQF